MSVTDILKKYASDYNDEDLSEIKDIINSL